MGDRTPFQQRVDEDLQQFVDAVAQQTNLSKADVMDEALRRLRENTTITDEGQFLVDDTYSAPDAEHGDNLLEELLANQQKMLSAIEEGIPATSRVDVKNNSQTRSPTTGSAARDDEEDTGSSTVPVRDDDSEGEIPEVATAEATITSLSGKVNHDECLDPDVVAEISIGGPDSRVKKTQEYLLPAVQAMINYKQADVGSHLNWEIIEKLITENLGLSPATARNYRRKLVNEGTVLPHPSNDESIVGDDAYEDVLVAAAKQTDPSVTQPSDIAVPEKCYPNSVRGFVGWAVAADDWDSDEWFVDDQIWLKQTWKLCRQMIKSMATLKPDTSRYGDEMTNDEKMAGACEVVVKLARRMADVSNERVDGGKIIALAKRATEIDPSDRDDLEEYAEFSSEVQAEVESAIDSDDDLDGFDREAVAELIGVDADVDDDVMKEACADYILENHPDKADSQEDALSAEEFHLLLSAKESLSEE
jgi:hypothetical protein